MGRGLSTLFCGLVSVGILSLSYSMQSSIAANGKSPLPDLDCLVQPKTVLKLGTPVPGLIKEVLVDRGSRVKVGDVIARLESGVEEAALALAKARAANDSAVRSNRARMGYAHRKEERTAQLRKNDNISVTLADEAETAARVAEADLRESEVNLELARLEVARSSELLNQRTIRSPIAGVVVARALGPGEYAYDQAHLLTVSQIDPLNVEVFVPLDFYGKIKEGSTAKIFPEEPVGGEYEATVSVVDHVFDAASRTFGVRIELPNPNYALPAGIKCRVHFLPDG